MRKWHANELETFNVLSIHQLHTYKPSRLAHVRFEITLNVHASGWAIFKENLQYTHLFNDHIKKFSLLPQTIFANLV